MATGCARLFTPRKDFIINFSRLPLWQQQMRDFSISEDQGEEKEISRSINKSQLFAGRIVITHSDSIFMLQRPQSHFEVM